MWTYGFTVMKTGLCKLFVSQTDNIIKNNTTFRLKTGKDCLPV